MVKDNPFCPYDTIVFDQSKSKFDEQIYISGKVVGFLTEVILYQPL